MKKSKKIKDKSRVKNIKKEENNIEMKLNKKFNIIFIILISILAISFVRVNFQNDTFYSIKIGDLILHNGIDMMDHFSFHKLPYTYPHWLYDVFIYIIYHLFGYFGIYASSIILFIILLITVFMTNKKICHSNIVAAFATFLCSLAISGFVTARAQLVTFILFALVIYSIESFLETGKWKYALYLLLISLLICNIHVAVWPFYFILYLPYLAEYAIAFITSKLKDSNKFKIFMLKRFQFEKNDKIKYLFLIMLASIMTGLLTPIKDTPYTYLIKTMAGNSQMYIKEHLMSSLKDSVFTIIIIVETFILALLSKNKLRDIFLIAGVSLMSIISVRHLSLVALLGTIAFSRVFANFLHNFNINYEEKLLRFFTNKKAVLVVSSIVIVFSSIMLYYNHKKDYIDTKLYPVEAVKYIKENIDINNMRLFNEYDFGSYLLLNDIPVFIDSRADLYTSEFNKLDYDIFDDYFFINNNYSEIFEFYHITHILIYRENSLYNKLNNNDNYKEIYKDKNFILYERTL